ncbi:MAG: rhodanese-like domain-containing protein [Flavobacteriales bacterium]|nr:rhodanese-like domain-containing protein [Flavobacteriales bacterium]
MRATFIALFLSFASFAHAQGSGVPDPLPGGSQSTVREISPQQLVALLGSSTLFIYDCNEEDMFAEAHVPGARLIVYDQITADKLPTDLNATLVFYCYSPECPAGGTAASTALALGHTDVYCMSAGITGWQDVGLKTEP